MLDNWEFAKQFARQTKEVKKNEVLIAFTRWLEETGFEDFDLDITRDWFRIFTGKEKNKHERSGSHRPNSGTEGWTKDNEYW